MLVQMLCSPLLVISSSIALRPAHIPSEHTHTHTHTLSLALLLVFNVTHTHTYMLSCYYNSILLLPPHILYCLPGTVQSILNVAYLFLDSLTFYSQFINALLDTYLYHTMCKKRTRMNLFLMTLNLF